MTFDGSEFHKLTICYMKKEHPFICHPESAANQVHQLTPSSHVVGEGRKLNPN